MNEMKKLDPALTDEVVSCLPWQMQNELASLNAPKVDELRLRVGGVCSTVTDGKSRTLQSRLGSGEADRILKKLCHDSLYAYADTLREGYITLRGGIRVGVGGRAVTERGGIVGVYDIQSLCIRVPHSIDGIGGRVCRLLRGGEGVLVYSRPGVGKTTLLRAVIKSLSTGDAALRVAVIDTRGELGYGIAENSSVDLLSGYPRGMGIEIAARTLNPQLIVCDEIGSESAEAASIKAAHNCGVPLLASAHASSVRGLLERSGIRQLHDAAIFGYYVGIERGGGVDYRYSITHANDAV